MLIYKVTYTYHSRDLNQTVYLCEDEVIADSPKGAIAAIQRFKSAREQKRNTDFNVVWTGLRTTDANAKVLRHNPIPVV